MIQFCVTLVCEFHGALTRAARDMDDPMADDNHPCWDQIGDLERDRLLPPQLTGRVRASPRRQVAAERAGHDCLPAIDLIPDDTLAGGLAHWLHDSLATAGFPRAEVSRVALQALRVRITGYRYLHVLLMLEADASHMNLLEELTPNTVRSLLLDYCRVLEPVYAQLAKASLLDLDAGSRYGVPVTLYDLELLEPREDTYLYDRHLVLSGSHRRLAANGGLPDAFAVPDDGRPTVVPGGGLVHRPWMGPIWCLEDPPDWIEFSYLLEGDTLVLAQRSAHENACTVSQALGEAVRNRLAASEARGARRRRSRVVHMPMTTAQLRLVSLRYALITNELAVRAMSLMDWQRAHQRDIVAVEGLQEVIDRADRGKEVVAGVIAQQEEADLRAHQSRIELVISVLTLLTVYSVAATITSFIRLERIDEVGDRLASGEAVFLAGLSTVVAALAWLLWRRR